MLLLIFNDFFYLKIKVKRNNGKKHYDQIEIEYIIYY